MISIAIGVLAAACFAYAERWSMVVGGVLAYFAFVFDCVDGQLARYTRQFSKLGAWLDSIFDRTKEYVVFAGLAIGASRTGDPVWLLAGAALALQTTRHAVDFSFPASQHQVIADTPQPPIENPFDVTGQGSRSTEPVEAEEVEEEDTQTPVAPAPAQMTLRRRLGRLWRAANRNVQIRWTEEDHRLPDGERFAAISITAALFDARTVFIGCSPGAASPLPTSWSAARSGRCCHERRDRPRRAGPHRPRDRSQVYRDDGPLATALGRALGHSIPLPAIALLLVAGLPLLVAIVLEGNGA